MGLWTKYETVADYFVASTAINRLSNNLSQVSNFLLEYDTICRNFQEYENFWTDKKFREVVDPVAFDDGDNGTFAIVDLKASRYEDITDDATTAAVTPEERKTAVPTVVSLDASEDKPITLKRGDLVYIAGESGAGKTTTLDAIQGKIVWCKLASGIDPAAYAHGIIEYKQKFAFNCPQLTIRDLFEGVPDAIIIRVCLMCNVPINESLLGSPPKFSGGQNTGLALAVTLCPALMNPDRYHMLVLDEATADFDHVKALLMMRAICSAFAEMIIVFTSHNTRLALQMKPNVVLAPYVMGDLMDRRYINVCGCASANSLASDDVDIYCVCFLKNLKYTAATTANLIYDRTRE